MSEKEVKEKYFGKDLLKIREETSFAIRFGTLYMAEVWNEENNSWELRVMLSSKRKDDKGNMVEEMLPFYAELPTPQTDNLHNWMEMTLMDNAERFFTLFTFVTDGVPCWECGYPIAVTDKIFSEEIYCNKCGCRLP